MPPSEKPKIRPKTEPRKDMPSKAREFNEQNPWYADWSENGRPQTRAECIDGFRPCLHWGCEYHLGVDVHPRTGSIKHNFPGKGPLDLEPSCALDVADEGTHTLKEVGTIMNITRERVRQLEKEGMDKIAKLMAEAEGLDCEKEFNILQVLQVLRELWLP